MADRLTGLLSPLLRQWRLAAVRRFIRTGQILDYGCGIGLLAASVSPECYVGLDIDSASLERAQQNFPRHRFYHVNHFEPDRVFDTCVSLAVIQYIAEPERFLSWALNLVRPGGNIVITTPNPAVDSLLLLGGRLGVFGRDDPDEHLSLLDKSGFYDLARKLDVRLIEYSRFMLGMNQLAVYERAR
jgi:2-polyprenyl-3-methyl-5-hydroxy-6-metoxy-1,4-benzoquinol methylase